MANQPGAYWRTWEAVFSGNFRANNGHLGPSSRGAHGESSWQYKSDWTAPASRNMYFTSLHTIESYKQSHMDWLADN